MNFIATILVALNYSLVGIYILIVMLTGAYNKFYLFQTLIIILVVLVVVFFYLLFDLFTLQNRTF